ncbi:MAG: hypothetical protein JW855_01185 [Gammaproteobacteria bacterium]|nr:hypothetical protein [Gammaproteobacteria bacterium]
MPNISRHRILLGKKSINESLRLLAISRGMLNFDVQWDNSDLKEIQGIYRLWLTNRENSVSLDLADKEIVTFPFGSGAKRIRILLRRAVDELYQRKG